MRWRRSRSPGPARNGLRWRRGRNPAPSRRCIRWLRGRGPRPASNGRRWLRGRQTVPSQSGLRGLRGQVPVRPQVAGDAACSTWNAGARTLPDTVTQRHVPRPAWSDAQLSSVPVVPAGASIGASTGGTAADARPSRPAHRTTALPTNAAQAPPHQGVSRSRAAKGSEAVVLHADAPGSAAGASAPMPPTAHEVSASWNSFPSMWSMTSRSCPRGPLRCHRQRHAEAIREGRHPLPQSHCLPTATATPSRR